MSLEPRWAHSLTACSLAPGLTEVAMCGGSLGTWDTEKKNKLTGTALLQFSESHPHLIKNKYCDFVVLKGLVDSVWKLHSTVESGQLGAQERVVEKIRYVAGAKMQEAVCKTILAEGERETGLEKKKGQHWSK